MRILLLIVAAAACTPMEPLVEAAGPCTVTDMLRSRYVGTKFRESMRDPLQTEANARIARVLRPDVSATMDVRADRLDVLVDDGGQIEGLRCG